MKQYRSPLLQRLPLYPEDSLLLTLSNKETTATPLSKSVVEVPLIEEGERKCNYWEE